jgi:hypothetical protein
MMINRQFVIAFVVIFCSVLYGCDYFQSDKQAEKKKEIVEKATELSPEKKLEFAEKCSKSGKVYFNSYIATNLPDGYLYDEPEYHYSSRLNTCLVHIRFVYSAADGEHSFHSNQVIDIFANKVLLQGHFTRDNKLKTEKLDDDTFNDAPNFTSTEYFKQKDILFSE